MKKGFTLIEILIAITILGTLISLSAVIFSSAVSTYRTEALRGSMQKDLNYTIDSIANNIKRGGAIIDIYGTDYTSSPTSIIIGLPAEDSSRDFIYSGDSLIFDNLIYQLKNGTIVKELYPALGSERSRQEETVLLKNVSTLNFEYLPNNTAKTQVKVTITISRQIGNKNITITTSRTANLRNR